MTELLSKSLLLDVFICTVGLCLHVAIKWNEARSIAAEKHLAMPGLGAYIASVPSQTTIALLGTVAAFTVTSAMEWMNPGMAFACGYVGNSIAENLANKFAQVQK